MLLELLEELRQEAEDLRRDDVLSGDFRYIERTRFERLIFLILKEYCALKLAFDDLGGLTDVHWRRLCKLVEEEKHSAEEFRIAEEGFEIYSLLSEICTAHIYGPSGTATKLGEDAGRTLGQIADRLERFIGRVRDSC